MISYNNTDIIYDIISFENIRQNLVVFPPKAVAGQIEGIAPCLGPSAVELTFLLNTAKGSKLSFAAMARDQVIFQDGIQLPRSPLSVALGGYSEFLSKVFADPRGEFCR